MHRPLMEPPDRFRSRRSASTEPPNARARAAVDGSGTTVTSKPQLWRVLVPPPLERSAKNNVHVPLAVRPPNVASKVLGESGSQVPVGLPGALWMLPLAVPLSLKVTLNPEPEEPKRIGG